MSDVGVQHVCAVVPLKAVARAKTRMAPTLGPLDRALLMHRTLGRVAEALAGAVGIDRVLVVCGDKVGATWAHELGLEVHTEQPGHRGLNAAIAEVDDVLGAAPTLVMPADLPLVTADDVDAVIAALPGPSGVVVTPTSDGGTGALLRVPGRVISPAFGPDSASAHHRAAVEAGVDVVTLRLAGFSLDLDRPTDLHAAGEPWRSLGTDRRGSAAGGSAGRRP